MVLIDITNVVVLNLTRSCPSKLDNRVCFVMDTVFAETHTRKNDKHRLAQLAKYHYLQTGRALTLVDKLNGSIIYWFWFRNHGNKSENKQITLHGQFDLKISRKKRLKLASFCKFVLQKVLICDCEQAIISKWDQSVFSIYIVCICFYLRSLVFH